MADPKLLSAKAVDSTTIDLQFDQPMIVGAEFLNPLSYSISPVIPGAITVSSQGSTVARLKLQTSMLNGQVYLIVVAENLRGTSGFFIDVGFKSASMVGIGQAPTLIGVEALSKSIVRATFSAAMRVTQLSKVENFGIKSEFTGKPVDIGAATPVNELAGLFSQVDLAIVSKMTNGGQHTLSVTGISDVVGNIQAPGQSATFAGISDLPRVIGAALSLVTGKLTVRFDSPMVRMWLDSLQSFAIVGQPGVPPIYYSQAEVSSNRESVTLVIEEPRNGAQYAVIADENVIDDYGNGVDPEYSGFVFVGIGTAPTIVSAITVGSNRIDVTFSKKMRDTAAIRDPSRWTISGGLTVVQVLSVNGEVVKLATTSQEPGVSYTLTIS